MHREIKKIVPDIQVRKSFTKMMIEYMFGDFEDKILYAVAQAKAKNHLSLTAEHAEDIHSIKWQMRKKHNGLLIPSEVFYSLSEKKREALMKMFEKIDVTLVVG